MKTKASISLLALLATLLLVAAAPAGAKVRMLNSGNTTVIGKVQCPAACTIATPKRVRVTIAGRGYWAQILAPRTLPKAGGVAKIQGKLGKGALAELAGRSARLAVRVVIRVGDEKRVQVLAAMLKRAAAESAGPGKGGTGGGPTSAPITSAEPPLLARPATAVDVGNVKVTWFPRDSWVRYASSGVAPNDGVKVGGGATALESKASPCPDRPSSSDALLAYGAEFVPRASWYDPLSGTAGIYGQGSVSFRWAAHTIDLTASDPEIEIAGAASRAIFRFSGSGGTPYPNQRAALVSLDTAGRPTVSNGGKTFTYSLMRGTLTADGVNVFAGFYTPPDNDEFGCVSVEFTTP
ncbi:MAG TPA: HtaA domain-containing protein [Solirubrobacterales bacterium]|nr:HtaA domain-containing protein [Solirubrobacterales bacterium]